MGTDDCGGARRSPEKFRPPMPHPVFAAIERSGLAPRGAFALEPSERVDPLADVRTLVLVGVVGAKGWDAFAGSAEARDGEAHPLDRWSRRVIDGLAREIGAAALYPFGGPPHWPFQRWARRAEPVHPSPLGLLIHPVHGLWHSYRGALGLREAIDLAPPQAARPSPCESCAGRPCLAACPVGAFSSAGYDVEACVAHLRSDAGEPCMRGGCLARRACPVAKEHAHAPEQARFTMRAFLRARLLDAAKP
jgi:hypothetical protein